MPAMEETLVRIDKAIRACQAMPMSTLSDDELAHTLDVIAAMDRQLERAEMRLRRRLAAIASVRLDPVGGSVD